MHYIFNADDFGRTATVNEAIVYGFDNCYLDRTSIMANMPYFEQAVQLAKSHGFMEKVGLHINLTSGEPLSEPIKSVRSLCGENGRFNGRVFSDRRMMLFLTAKEKTVISVEIEAQIRKFLQYGFTLMHADSHGHVHTFPAMQRVVLKTASESGIRSIRISANLHSKGWKMQVKRIQNGKLVQFNKKHGNDVAFFDSFKNVMANYSAINMGTGVCEVMLHPNIWDGDMQIGEGLHYTNLDSFKVREGFEDGKN